MRTLVILVCILTTSFYFLSTINASQVDEWEEWSDGYHLSEKDKKSTWSIDTVFMGVDHVSS